MESGMNPALQAILDSLNESSNTSPEPPSINNESPSMIPGLGFLPGPETPTARTRILEVVAPKSRTMTPTPDASRITAWPAALKYVTKHIGPSEALGNKIRQLIAEQHKHEEQWWAGREAIINKHKSRVDKQQEAADLLQSLGGIPTTLRPINEGSERAELEGYDKKVYGELVKMTAAYDRQLRALGIPFYAIKHDLVIFENDREQGGNARIDRGELRELQKRMLQHLQDLFLEDG